jgi:hypothetical protein
MADSKKVSSIKARVFMDVPPYPISASDPCAVSNTKGGVHS